INRKKNLLIWCFVKRSVHIEGNLFCFFSPPRKDKRNPTAQNNTFANRCKPALQSKVCKRVVFLPALH
ncbi:MAG: hypothetical protein PHR88_09670, partial [Proteiniphilum sp.]|nr:hypothetical protein [Proteiniphilum sp.]